MIWLLGSAYTVIAIGIARLLAGHFAWRMHRIDTTKYAYTNKRIMPTDYQWFGAWCLALLLCMVWPLALLPAWVGSRYAIGEEREAKLKGRETRIKQLEEELNIQ